MVRRQGQGKAQRPELRQFADLAPDDFVRVPIWIACHVADYDENWYDETDEETFRPWTGTGKVPIGPTYPTFLIRALATFADRSVHPACLSPARNASDLGEIQPQTFLHGRRFSFWHGAMDPEAERDAFYRAAKRNLRDIFTITFTADVGSLVSMPKVAVTGFYTTRSGRIEVVT